jgi:sulfide:quinone oxidoreductase
LRALAEDRVSIELVSSDDEFVYRPLAVADPFRVGETRRFPLARLVDAAGATLTRGLVAAVDPDRRVVETRDGGELPYDSLLIAVGARPREGVPGAMTFAGPESGPALEGILQEALHGKLRRIAFAVPGGVTWPLPLYELALLTNAFLVDRYASGVEIVVVTPEERPLGLFGPRASDAVAELLALRGIEFRGGTTPLRFEDGALQVAPTEAIAADRVVALARLKGPRLEGLPFDRDGFIPVDRYCRVGSEVDVYAAGDATRFPLKQGGIAAQQADCAAAQIASRAGAEVKTGPFRPVLRGLLLTGMTPRFLRAEPGTPDSDVDTQALWSPPAKIVGRYLSPFLAEKVGAGV